MNVRKPVSVGSSEYTWIYANIHDYATIRQNTYNLGIIITQNVAATFTKLPESGHDMNVGGYSDTYPYLEQQVKRRCT